MKARRVPIQLRDGSLPPFHPVPTPLRYSLHSIIVQCIFLAAAAYAPLAFGTTSHWIIWMYLLHIKSFYITNGILPIVPESYLNDDQNLLSLQDEHRQRVCSDSQTSSPQIRPYMHATHQSDHAMQLSQPLQGPECLQAWHARNPLSQMQ